MNREAVFAALAAAALLSACRGNPDDLVRPEPVAECVQYESAMMACFHREQGFAEQASMIPKTVAERDQLRQTCTESLKKIQQTCR